MERNSLFTAFKRYILFYTFILIVFLFAGCGQQDFSPIDESSTGFFNQYFVYPFSLLIKGLANLFGGNYGFAIIVTTITIRFLLMPFFLRQAKSSKESQEKMPLLVPEMQKIQEKYKGKNSPEDRLKMQQEVSDLYEKYDYNPVQMVTGCLPILLQMPILIGFFYAIRRTPEIAEHSFLWFNLGEVDILLAALAALIYFAQSRISLIGLNEEQKKQMAIMGWISPIIIGIFSLNVPAALPLYWTVSGIFMIGQTLMIKRMV